LVIDLLYFLKKLSHLILRWQPVAEAEAAELQRLQLNRPELKFLVTYQQLSLQPFRLLTGHFSCRLKHRTSVSPAGMNLTFTGSRHTKPRQQGP
jgi:hypothetical protein